MKQLLRRVAPIPYAFLAQVTRKRADRRYAQIEAKIIERLGLVVQGGPFEGMKYLPAAFYGALSPKLIGCYEAELHDELETIKHNHYATLVDIGCAEGYYAVGLARWFPDAVMVAFDSEEEARVLCRNLSNINGVEERVDVRGACSVDELNALPLSGGFVICDCEGTELELMNPERVSALKTCDLLIELHDFVDAMISPTIVARFQNTHDITVIQNAPRDAKDYPCIEFLPESERVMAVSDRRWKPDQWAFMTVKK